MGKELLHVFDNACYSYTFAVCNEVAHHWQVVLLLYAISHNTSVYQQSQFKLPNEANSYTLYVSFDIWMF